MNYLSNQDLKAELTQNLDQAEWEWLIPHAMRDAVIVVTNELDLLDVGAAVASNNLSLVQHWIEEALIAKPSSQQLGEWNTKRQKQFNTLIVQPYVLVKEKISS